MDLDKRTFSIIIILTTVISYLIIRKFFKIAPRYLLYGGIGIFIGLSVGITIALPISAFLGHFGIIVAPYILGVILMVGVEICVVEGGRMIDEIKKKLHDSRAFRKY